jgi:hypothetical protein
MWPEAYNSKNDKKGQTIMYDMQKTKDRTTLAPLKPRDEQRYESIYVKCFVIMSFTGKH